MNCTQGIIMTDKDIIKKLGGSAVLARYLKMKYTTVHNWTTSGIPAKYKLQHPELFLPKHPTRLDNQQLKQETP